MHTAEHPLFLSECRRAARRSIVLVSSHTAMLLLILTVKFHKRSGSQVAKLQQTGSASVGENHRNMLPEEMHDKQYAVYIAINPNGKYISCVLF